MQVVLIRLFDILFSFLALILLTPIWLVLAILIVADSSGPVFFIQERIGRYGIPFKLYKLRTMSHQKQTGLLLTTKNDKRITKIGKWLRLKKLDETPQLWNVFIGNMSLVGPRPEVSKYTELYTADQKKILNIRPGITDFASIVYRNEQTILARYNNPEKVYIECILPRKIRLNKIYLKRINIVNYFYILLLTVAGRTRFYVR
jgi:lipopolysaccharide/colanic/teichoic acid biosynthesis glycosyltransferase